MDEDQDQKEVAGAGCVGQLPALVIEHGSSGRSAVHALGQASVGIGKFVDKANRLLVLYTGGTMGMKPDANGALAPLPGFLSDQIAILLKQHGSDPLPSVEVKEYEELLDSCDMGPVQWRQVALDIQRAYDDFDGFVVIMGTDTMAYTASALSFMLENLGKTVIITGSQVPFGRIHSDARRNLLFSFSLACTLDIPEVCIVFDQVLLRGVRSRKDDSSSFAAFTTPFMPPLAALGLSVQVNTSLLLPQPKGPFRVHENMRAKVVVMKVVPSSDLAALLRLASLGAPEAKAAVLEMSVPRVLPLVDPHFLLALRKAKEQGLVIVLTSPPPSNRPGKNLSPWAQASTSLLRGEPPRAEEGWRGTHALDASDDENGGVMERQRGGDYVSAVDMTTEACCAKLAYLFGKGLSPAEVATLMTHNLRGELSGPYVGEARAIARILASSSQGLVGDAPAAAAAAAAAAPPAAVHTPHSLSKL